MKLKVVLEKAGEGSMLFTYLASRMHFLSETRKEALRNISEAVELYLE